MGRPKVENNIHRIAQLAGVSISTVSRVINHSETVKKETADQVRAAMKSVHYTGPIRPPRPAKTACRNIVFVTGYLFEEISMFPKLIDGVSSILRQEQYRLLVYIQRDSTPQVDDILSFAVDNDAEGIIISTRMREEDLERMQRVFPCVQCYEYNTHYHCGYVSSDFKKAIEKMMNYLFSINRKKVAFISLTDEEGYTASLRREAFLQCMHGQECEVPEKWLISLAPPVSFDNAVAAGSYLLSDKDRPDAIVCTSDVFASAIIRSAQQKGLRVPEDLVVVGFDNNVISKISSPTITTIKHSVYEIGYATGMMMLEMIRNPKQKHQRGVLLDTELILRASSEAV